MSIVVVVATLVAVIVAVATGCIAVVVAIAIALWYGPLLLQPDVVAVLTPAAVVSIVLGVAAAI